MEPHDYSFPKRQRLCGKKAVDALFAGGESFFAYPFRVVFRVETAGGNGGGPAADNQAEAAGRNETDGAGHNEADEANNHDEVTVGGVRVLISVGKKHHKRAIVRNLLKRRTREAFRHHAQPLKDVCGKTIHLALLYSSKEILDYGDIEHGVKKAISALRQALSL